MGSAPRRPFTRLQNSTAKALRSAASFSLVDLGGQVELHETVLAPLEVILHEQWRIWAKTQLNSTTEGSCLCKVHQVAQGECCCHGLVHCQRNPLFWPFGLPWLQHHIA